MAVAALAGCTSSGGAGSADTSAAVTSVASAPAGFRALTLTVHRADGTTVTRCVLVADTEGLRQRGLMGVTAADVADGRLAGFDGMLFVFAQDAPNGFWMKDTLIPLSIAFADASGSVVGTDDMVPCPSGTAQCPVTRPDAAYRYALEVPSGALGAFGLVEGAALDPTLGPSCSAAST